MSDRPWLDQYDDGVPETIDYPEVPLFYFLEKSAQDYPEATCTVFKGAKITYSEMNDLVDRLAAGLVSLGVQKGDRIGLFIPNTPQFMMAYYAVLKAGAAVVATNPMYSAREIVHQANDSGMKLMIVMSNFYQRVKDVQDQTKIEKIVVTNIKEALPPLTSFLFTLLKEKKSGFRVELGEGDIWMQDLMAQYKPEDRPKIDVGSEDVALFQYSGGTTGTPKAAIATHRNLVCNTLQIRRWMPEA
ncbi:MAG: AMP-binding protein, partial [Chloroflexota bacterium]